MRVVSCIALLIIAVLSSCVTQSPAIERVNESSLSDENGLMIVQFLRIGVNKKGDEFFDYMQGYYPRLVGDAKKNLKSPVDSNGFGVYSVAQGRYEIERLRQISRDEEYKTTIRYPVGIPVVIEANKVTNLGMLLFLSDKEPGSLRFHLIRVDNENLVRDHLKTNYDGDIPEAFENQLRPQLSSVATIEELRAYLETLYSEEFLSTIPELN